MDESTIVKLRNYFSDRIEEIKDGSYVPTLEQIKELPEFSEIKRETFRIARKKWYLQHFRMSSVRFSARLENIKAGYISEKKFVARLENIKGEYISEEEYDKEQIKGKRGNGFCILIIGVLFILLAQSLALNTLGSESWGGGYGLYWILFTILGIMLVVFGILLAQSDKFREKIYDEGYCKGFCCLIPAVFYIVMGVLAWFPLIFVGIILVAIAFCPILSNIIKMSEQESPIISDRQERESPLELSLRDNAGALLTSPNKAKDFYISVRNPSPILMPDVEVQLSGPPQVKIVDATKSYGSIGSFSASSARFTILAEETGIFTLTATLQSEVDNKITLSIEFRVETGA